MASSERWMVWLGSHSRLGIMVSRKIALKMSTSSSPEPEMTLPFRASRTFQVWLRMLRFRENPGVLRYHHRGPCNRRQGGQSQRERCDHASRGPSDAAMSQGMQVASRNLKRQGNKFSLQRIHHLQRNWSSANTVILAPQDSYQTSDFQNWKIVNLCCFESFSWVVFC